MDARPLRLARRFHGALLLLHPRAFRDRFGDELSEDFARLAEEAFERGGARALLGLSLRVGADTLRTTVRERGLLRAEWEAATGWRAHRREEREGMMRTFARDAVVGARMLGRRPVFAAAAIGTLALGIGANAMIFSVVNGVLLSPLPFPDPDALVRVYHANPETGNRRGTFSLPDREEWAERTTSLQQIAVYTTLPSGLLLTGGQEPVELRTAYVSGGFFEVFGRDALHGRVLSDEEEYGDNRVIVLSHGFWARRYGSDPSIVGSDIQLDDTSFRVVGVMPPDFTYPSPEVEGWAFLSIIPPSSIPLQIRQVRFLEAVGRVAPGITRAQATEELHAVAASLARDFPEDNAELTEAELVPLRTSLTGDVETTLLVLLGAVGLVLLIACANVANLLLSRAAERSRELQIRRALGAPRGRLVRQLLTESLLLGAVGGTAGLGLAVWGTGALLARSDGLIPRSGEVGLDRTVLLFSIGITLLSALLSGALPALRMTRASAPGLSSSSRGVRGAGTRTWATLVAGQVGIATVVVIASGLLLRSLMALQGVDTGLEDDRIVALSLTINDARYPERAEYLAAYEELMEQIRGVPGVESVASIRFLPLRRDGESLNYRPEGTAAGERAEVASMLQVSPGFFSTAGVPVTEGRELGLDDRAESAPVAVINEALKRRHWGDRSPVGSFLELPGDLQVEIVGVVGDIRQRGLGEEVAPTIYLPQSQNPRRGMAFVIRTASDPAALIADVRAAVRQVDPDQPIDDLRVMEDVVASSTSRPRFFSVLLAGFAALSLLLAGLGVYGVVSHSVSRRVSEIGVRVALGAPRRGLVGMVVRTGMRPVVIGAVAGVAAAVPTMRLLRGTVFGVSTVDPLTFAAVPVLLVATALLACWLPASRATRIDPTEALRAE